MPPGAAQPNGKIIDAAPPRREPAHEPVATRVFPPVKQPNDQISALLGGGCALAIIIAPIYLLLSWCSGPSKTPEEIKAEQAQSLEDQRKGFHCLSAWDGSNKSFVDAVKRQLRDPNSFEIVETRITPVESGKHVIMMEYRARNGFGGMNVATAIGTVDHTTCNATVASIGE